jgi:hypothetical protein
MKPILLSLFLLLGLCAFAQEKLTLTGLHDGQKEYPFVMEKITWDQVVETDFYNKYPAKDVVTIVFETASTDGKNPDAFIRISMVATEFKVPGTWNFGGEWGERGLTFPNYPLAIFAGKYWSPYFTNKGPRPAKGYTVSDGHGKLIIEKQEGNVLIGRVEDLKVFGDAYDPYDPKKKDSQVGSILFKTFSFKATKAVK